MKFKFPVLLSLIAFCFCVTIINAQTQQKNTAKFIEYKNQFWEEIRKSGEDAEKKDKKPSLTFKMDFTGVEVPKSPDEFKQVWHNQPLSQGATGTCWCFSTSSYLESEIYRQTKQKIKISEMFTVYWEYVEKAKRFIKERGISSFGEGSEANAVSIIWKMYGCVPEEIYNGLMPNQKFHNQSKMFGEMNAYLQSIKNTNAWNEGEAISTIKSILNHYIGEPPQKFNYSGKEYTPKEFLEKDVKINPDEYLDIMSLMEHPYYQKCLYDVEDNWWRSEDYYNVPLDDYMKYLKKAVKAGYSVCIGGDVSESGYSSQEQAAVIPTYDIPSEYIDENARQLRFTNKTTTDDHGIHIVGYKEKDGKFWFLIKDSGSGSFNGVNKGYYFYHEDYIKLKMMTFTVHRSAVEDLLKKFDK